MAEADATTVKLLKPDGLQVAVPVDKLSPPDQAFVKSFLAAEAALGAQPSQPDPDNPFAGGETPAGGSGRELASSTGPGIGSGASASASAGGMTLDTIPMTDMSSSSVETIAIDFGEPFWNAEPLRPIQYEPVKAASIALPMPKGFFETLSMDVVGREPAALFSIYSEGRARQEKGTRLGRYSFSDRKPVALGQANQPWKILATNFDGSLIALVRIEGFDKGNDVVIAKVGSDAVTPLVQFTAGGGSWAEVRWAAFLGNDRLISIDQKHVLSIWDLRNRQRTHQGKVADGTITAEAAPGGQMIAIPGKGVIALLDGKSLEQVGTIALETSDQPSLAFSDDGAHLAAYTPFAVEVYSLADGQRTKRIPVSESEPGKPIRWVGANLLLSNRLLIDVERERPWWSYDVGQGRTPSVLGNSIFVVFGGDKGSHLVVQPIPHQAAETAASRGDSSDLLALSDGAPVTLSLQLNGITQADQQRIREAIEQKVAENGWRITAGAPNVIELVVRQGEEKKQEYVETRFPGPGFALPGQPTTEARYRPWLHTLIIKVSGQEVFSAQRTAGAPMSLTAKEGKTTQQLVDEAVKPSPQFFVDVRLPKQVVKPEYRDGLGKSQLTAQGLR